MSNARQNRKKECDRWTTRIDQAIEGLFSKLGEVDRQAGPRDAEADGLIRARITAQPAAPYFMAQTVVIQEQALTTAQARIEELELNLASRPTSGGRSPVRPLWRWAT